MKPTSHRYGVSFSIKQCRDFDIDPVKCLDWLINHAGFRRFRLMSYWNECETSQGTYDFAALDKQFEQIEHVGGTVTLCLGVRQPRWPESHWPEWALQLPKKQRYAALETFIKAVVEQYKSRASVVSYQLENEALNRSFGLNGDFSRRRLRNEFALVKKLDPKRPVIMTTSNSWGLPFSGPMPDVIGFSLYRVIYANGGYGFSKTPIWLYNLRAFLAKLLLKRQSFIHELQLEPWGPKAIWEMPIAEQNKSMPTGQIRTNVRLAGSTGLHPTDLWGGEWWYWRWQKFNDASISEAVLAALEQHTGR